MLSQLKIKRYELKLTIYYDVLMGKFVLELYSKIYDKKSVIILANMPSDLSFYLERLFENIINDKTK